MTRVWTSKEEQILKQVYQAQSKEQILQQLASRTWSGIAIHAQKLKLFRECVSLQSILENRPKLTLSEVQKAWIAGAFDFEGTIGIARMGNEKSHKYFKMRYRPYLSVVNTNIRLLEEVKKILGLGIIDKTSYADHSDRWKPAYMARTHDMGRVYSTLETVLPYLIAKVKQAYCVMEFIEIQDDRHVKLRLGTATQYTPRQLAIVEELHSLNRRGRIVGGGE